METRYRWRTKFFLTVSGLVCQVSDDIRIQGVLELQREKTRLFSVVCIRAQSDQILNEILFQMNSNISFNGDKVFYNFKHM